MASRLAQRPTRVILSSLATTAKKPVPRHASALHSMSSTAARPQPFTQAPVHLRTITTVSPPFPSEALQLQASADLEDRQILISAISNAVSKSGGFLSQTNDMLSETVFVMEDIGNEKLAAFHSLLESMTLALDQSTQKVLQECYFSLLEAHKEEEKPEASAAVLRLNWLKR